MMKRLILALSITLLASQALGADYRYKVPVPRPAPEKLLDPSVPYADLSRTAALHLAQNVNPDPWHTKNPQVVQVQPQQPINVPPNQPVVVQTAPAIDTNPGLLSWVLTAIAGTGVGGIIANLFRKQPTSPAQVDPTHVVGTLVQNPDFEDKLEQVLGKLLNSDVLRGGVRSGISLIPGAGGFAQIIEETANRAAKMALQAKFGDPGPQAPTFTGSGSTNPVPDDLNVWKRELLKDVGDIVQKRIEAALMTRAQS